MASSASPRAAEPCAIVGGMKQSPHKSIPFAGALLGAACIFAAPSGAQDWPAFRGPTGDGVYSGKSPALKWSKEAGVKWRVSLERPANGSPIVSGGRVFLTAAKDEEGKERALYCFDRANGKLLWERVVPCAEVMPTHATNPYGGSTPAADGKRVVVWHATAGLCCYDFEGEELWTRKFGEFRHKWGYGTSPRIVGDRVLLHSGPGKTSFVALFDLADGKTIWRQVEPVEDYGVDGMKPRMTGSWHTPLVWTEKTDDGPRKIVLCGQPTRLVAYDFASGEILWHCSGLRCKRGDLTYSSPVVAEDLCYVQGGYQGPSLGVRLGGSGDVTETRRAWYREDVASSVGSGVVAKGAIYQPFMRSLACIDPVRGEALWVERPGKGQIWSSIVRAGDRMYLMDQKGTTFVFAPNTKKFALLAKNELGEKTNSTPAISDGEIFLRTHESLYCIAAPAEPAKAKD